MFPFLTSFACFFYKQRAYTTVQKKAEASIPGGKIHNFFEMKSDSRAHHSDTYLHYLHNARTAQLLLHMSMYLPLFVATRMIPDVKSNDPYFCYSQCILKKKLTHKMQETKTGSSHFLIVIGAMKNKIYSVLLQLFQQFKSA